MSSPASLSLSGRVAPARRVTEKSFEEAFAAALRRQGLESWHISARDAGWPDRYVHTGIWIEFKVLKSLANDQLEPEQKARMRDLARAGEEVWYVARHDHNIHMHPYPSGINLQFDYREVDAAAQWIATQWEISHA